MPESAAPDGRDQARRAAAPHRRRPSGPTPLGSSATGPPASRRHGQSLSGSSPPSPGSNAYDAAFAYLYEEASSITTAAVRLLPIDGAAAARMLVEAEPEIERLAAEAALRERLPGGFAPALELGSLAHAAREGRLFAS